MTDMTPENDFSGDLQPESSGDLVYALAGLAGLQPGENGVALTGRTSGLFRSADGGQTWQDVLADQPLSEPLPVLALAAAPQAGEQGVLLAGVPGGVFRSTDAGQTWRAVLLPQPPPTVSALVAAPRTDEDPAFFAGTMEDGVFISLNGGASWVAWNFGLLDLNVMCLAVSPGFASDETLFAGTESGIFRSTNGGRAWRDLELPFGFEAIISLALSPGFASDRTLYSGSESHGLWVSRDGGDTWQPLGAFEDPINAILVDRDGLLVITSSSLWRSGDGGASWEDCLPAGYDEREISTVLAPNGFGAGANVLVGFLDGAVETVTVE